MQRASLLSNHQVFIELSYEVTLVVVQHLCYYSFLFLQLSPLSGPSPGNAAALGRGDSTQLLTAVLPGAGWSGTRDVKQQVDT